MKKKKLKFDADSTPVVELKSVIHQHSLFFDKLVELIPAKFYLPTDDKDKPWFQGLSKAEKASVKKETKENIKKARRDRLDPEKSSTTTLDLLKQSLEKEKQYDENDDEELEYKPNLSSLEDDNRSVTYEELRQRLRRRIEEFRASRNTGGSDKANKKTERNDKKGIEQKKCKRDAESKEKEPKAGNSNDKVDRDVVEASKELTFSHVKLGNEDDRGKKKKKRKLSKLQELERAKKLEEAKKDPEKGDVISKKQSWNAAASRAAGEKVHDNPKLLKQSIQKEKRRQQKNAQRWKERVQATQKMKAERQQKRSENIAAKKHDKKMRKIAKREKKLMRPGFEGRKEGFVNEGAA